MTTGRDVIYDALRRAGITGRGITPTNTDTTDALADLNDMLGQWRTQRFMQWSLLSTGFTADGRSTGGYTVGPTGEYAMTPRPNRIESAFVRQLSNSGNLLVDTPLRVISAREEYDRISLKALVSFPMAVFLDTTLPQALLKPYPWPNAGQYAVYITTKNTMPVVTLATDMSAFPDGYVPAMKFNLARRLRQSYGKGMKPDSELIRLANDALDVVMQANIQLPEMQMPVALLTRNGSGYNIISDQGA